MTLLGGGGGWVVTLQATKVPPLRNKNMTGVVMMKMYSVMYDLFATPWTVARQGPLSMEFSRQEY